MDEDAVDAQVNVPPVLLYTLRRIIPGVVDALAYCRMRPPCDVVTVVDARVTNILSPLLMPVNAEGPPVPAEQSTSALEDAAMVFAYALMVQVPSFKPVTAVPTELSVSWPLELNTVLKLCSVPTPKPRPAI